MKEVFCMVIKTLLIVHYKLSEFSHDINISNCTKLHILA